MTSDEEEKKRAIFEGMSKRRQERILKKGYDQWDPFLAPKEPPFFNPEERARVHAAGLRLERFLVHRSGQTGGEGGDLPSDYVQGARAICFGLAKGEERYQGMRDFCRWLDRVEEES
jgi:hypothetical protein